MKNFFRFFQRSQSKSRTPSTTNLHTEVPEQPITDLLDIKNKIKIRAGSNDPFHLELYVTKDKDARKFTFIDGSSLVCIITEDVVFQGKRTDGNVQLVTGGRVILPPNYDRAKGDRFENYNDAATVVENYHNYKLPEPKPKKKKFWQKAARAVSSALGIVSSVGAASTTPQGAVIGAVAGGAAAGIEGILAHQDKKDNRKLEAQKNKMLKRNIKSTKHVLKPKELIFCKM